MAIKNEPQTHMQEQALAANIPLEEALTVMTESEEEGKRYNTAKAKANRMVKDMNLAEGLYRIGPFQIKIDDIEGGGFEMPKWSSKRIGIKGPE